MKAGNQYEGHNFGSFDFWPGKLRQNFLRVDIDILAKFARPKILLSFSSWTKFTYRSELLCKASRSTKKNCEHGSELMACCNKPARQICQRISVLNVDVLLIEAL